ncbi:MAG: hypothetical protein ACRD3L_10250 [Terriglobales bacterium]
MELLLNLIWLTLALPAIAIWRSRVPAHLTGTSRLRASLLLICVLTLLFPVVSATDDLHPMRAEMEESNRFKRVVQQSNNNSSSAFSTAGGLLVRSISDAQICPDNEVFALVRIHSVVVPDLVTFSRHCARPPPLSFFV